MSRIYRAADSDYVTRGSCFSAERSVAEQYLADRCEQPGFGGANLYAARIPAGLRVLDLTDESQAAEILSAELGREVETSGRWCDALHGRTDDLMDELADLGWHVILVSETYPSDTVSLVLVSDAAIEAVEDSIRLA